MRPGSAPDPTGEASVQQHRFPCGHTEALGSLRMHVDFERHVAWAACRACNVIALVVEPPRRRERGRSAARRSP